MFTGSEQLSPHFRLGEFLRSPTAVRHGIDMMPPAIVVERLTQLCLGYLEIIRLAVDAPIWITSGYRPPDLNKVIKGNSASGHMLGLAADFVVYGQDTGSVFRHIRDQLKFDRPYDQMFLEHGQWIHLSFMPVPREQHGHILAGVERQPEEAQ